MSVNGQCLLSFVVVVVVVVVNVHVHVLLLVVRCLILGDADDAMDEAVGSTTTPKSDEGG